MLPMQALGHNPHIYAISAAHYRTAPFRPAHLILNFVCMSLGHRMLRVSLSDGQGSSINRGGGGCCSGSGGGGELVASTRKLHAAYYRYRCLAIQSLNEELGVEEKGRSDFVLAGIVMVFLIDVSFILGTF
jgi:hypothetical protein